MHRSPHLMHDITYELLSLVFFMRQSSISHCRIGWVALLTCRLGVDFGRQLPTNLLSVRRVQCHSWRTIIGFCWPKAVEQSSRWHYICFIIDSVSTKSENAFISAVISGHYYVFVVVLTMVELEWMFYRCWRPHDRIFTHLDKTPERDGQTDRRTDRQPMLLQLSLRAMRTRCKNCYIT